MKIFDSLQSIGKALMLPVAVLPAAAILLRFGADDFLNIDVLEKAGGALFTNLPPIFAVAIAFGLTRDKNDNGAAGLAGFVCYSVLTAALKSLDEGIDMGVFAGIVSGLTTAFLYNRFYTFTPPEYLRFFGGRRFVPIITSVAAILLALIFSVVWPPIQDTITFLSDNIINLGSGGVFIYGLLNRLLLPFGLHHILNNVIYFVVGSYTNPVTGEILHGDIPRFFAGDPTAGVFSTGGYLVMMFGLPAVTLAMYRTAKPENRAKVAGALLSMALTSFLTGITEPIEFSFMFLAPALYAAHALLMGAAMAVCYSLNVIEGASFSPGLIDCVLNWGLATNPIMIIPLGLIFGAIYYLLFSWAIVHFNLPTLGRYDEKTSAETSDAASDTDDERDFAVQIIDGLGGRDNLVTVENCITRLRVTVKDPAAVDESRLKSLAGVKGVFSKGTGIQVVVGLQAEALANDINRN